MGVAATLRRFDLAGPRLTRRELRRGVIAGVTWGAALTLGLAAMTVLSCGGICLTEVAVDGALSLVAGLLGIGPIAAYGRRKSCALR
jgi:hypothetical protein